MVDYQKYRSYLVAALVGLAVGAGTGGILIYLGIQLFAWDLKQWWWAVITAGIGGLLAGPCARWMSATPEGEKPPLVGFLSIALGTFGAAGTPLAKEDTTFAVCYIICMTLLIALGLFRIPVHYVFPSRREAQRAHDAFKFLQKLADDHQIDRTDILPGVNVARNFKQTYCMATYEQAAAVLREMAASFAKKIYDECEELKERVGSLSVAMDRLATRHQLPKDGIRNLYNVGEAIPGPDAVHQLARAIRRRYNDEVSDQEMAAIARRYSISPATVKLLSEWKP